MNISVAGNARPPSKQRKSFATLADLIDHQCTEHGDLEVLTFVAVETDGALSDERRTFAELRANARQLAAWLQASGVRPGDRVALMMHNHPEFVEAMIASAYIGAVFVPIDPRSIGEKLSYMLNFVEAEVVIAGSSALDQIAAVAGDLGSLKSVLVVGAVAPVRSDAAIRYSSASELPLGAEEGFVRVYPDPSTPMFMMFTSGTTGHPKAVVRSHVKHMAGLRGLKALGVEPWHRLYTGLPLSHINAQSTLGMALATPQPAVISQRFTKSRLWDVCRQYDCHVLTLLGGMIPEIYAIPEEEGDADNPLCLVISSGMPAALWGEYRRRYGVEITEVYGSTEAGGVLINLRGEGPEGSMGKPPKGTEAAILDGEGAVCPPLVSGELCFRPASGKAEAVTYFRNPEASVEKVNAGWFRTGDIAHQDEAGWFYFHHRSGGGVRRNGDFINTALVETVLAQSGLISDVFVYGVERPGNVAGEKTLVAAIVLQEGADVDALRAWCQGRLQKNELPEIWQSLAAIPKTISEKPVERACIDLLQETGAGYTVPGDPLTLIGKAGK